MNRRIETIGIRSLGARRGFACLRIGKVPFADPVALVILESARWQQRALTQEEMAKGNAVTLIPVHAELRTQEAADMLTISRPSLIQLLDEGKIDYRRVGTHRRVRFEALMKFKRQADADRKSALAELAAYEQELGI